MHEHTWDSEMGQVYGGWIGPYQGIMQTMVVMDDLQKLDYPSLGMTEADKKQHIAELRTLRAWFYTFLIDFFREVPIQQTIGELTAQSTPQEVFNYIKNAASE